MAITSLEFESKRDRAYDEPASPPRQRHMACTRDDLVCVLMEAFRFGSAQAGEDGSAVLPTSDALFGAASAACDEALQTFVPLDERAFREVFTLAWAAGYRAASLASSPPARAGAPDAQCTPPEAVKRLHG
jgi:hypothetical protein